MTKQQIEQEIEKTTKMKNLLFACVENGQMEYYQQYIDTSVYLVMLSKY